MLNVRNYAVYAWLLCIPLLLSMQAVNASHLPEFTDLVKETSQYNPEGQERHAATPGRV